MRKPLKERLTVDDVRKHEGFEQCSDEEIEGVIDVVEKLALLIYRRIKRLQKSDHDNEQEKLTEENDKRELSQGSVS